MSKVTNPPLNLDELGLVTARSLLKGEVAASPSLSPQLNSISSQSDESESDSSDDTLRSIRWSAMGLLARREHAYRELRQKLLKRYPDDSTLVDVVLDQLQAENLQSDARFAEAYVAMRKRKGFGPQRIIQELRDKGVNGELANAEVFDEQNDWTEAAFTSWSRKFTRAAQGNTQRDLKEKAKQLRFLQYRGFSQDDYQHFI